MYNWRFNEKESLLEVQYDGEIPINDIQVMLTEMDEKLNGTYNELRVLIDGRKADYVVNSLSELEKIGKIVISLKQRVRKIRHATVFAEIMPPAVSSIFKQKVKQLDGYEYALFGSIHQAREWLNLDKV
ncbi:MAG: hypothetical protein C0594_03345 [Marinilabiliales bacterium]|nr:MAG: hypothetical protein C0594_03345 [Marinilabiliales bacterium]